MAFILTDDERKVVGSTKNLQESFIITNKKLSNKSRVFEIL